MEQYHDNNGHTGIAEIHDAIKKVLLAKYVQKPISICNILCNPSEKKRRKVKPPQQETNTAPYLFAKLGLDVSRPYPKILLDNKYVTGFILSL